MIIEQLRPKNEAGIFGSVREEIVFRKVSLEKPVLPKTFPAVKHRTHFLFSTFLPKYLLESILKTTAPRSHSLLCILPTSGQ